MFIKNLALVVFYFSDIKWSLIGAQAGNDTIGGGKFKRNCISDTIISNITVYAVCAIYTVYTKLSEPCKCLRLRARAIIHNIPRTCNI